MEMILELVVGVIDMEVDKVADETTNEVADMEVYKEGKIFKNVKIVKKKVIKNGGSLHFTCGDVFLLFSFLICSPDQQGGTTQQKLPLKL